MTSTVSRLSCGSFIVFSILIMEYKRAVPRFNPAAWSTLLIICHDLSNGLLPAPHLSGIRHLGPFACHELFDETTIFSDQPEVSNAVEEWVQLVRHATTHDVNNISFILEKVVQDVQRSLTSVSLSIIALVKNDLPVDLSR